MAIDENGNGIAYLMDIEKTSIYHMKYAGVEVVQVGVDHNTLTIKIRKTPNDEWMITQGKAMTREDGRISGAFMQAFIIANMPKILLDTYVIPEVTKMVEVPDGVPIDWEIPPSA